MTRAIRFELPDDCDCPIDVVLDCIRQALSAHGDIQAEDDCAKCYPALAKRALEAKESFGLGLNPKAAHSGPYAAAGPIPDGGTTRMP